jgi:cellobiose phosphorylase
VRAFRDDGRPLGVRGEKEGFLWINSQTWAVIGGLGSPERLNACMDAVEQHLGTAYGLMNVGPAYTKFDPTIGILSAFLAGWKENAAVFSHASAFNVVARAMLGRGRDALDLWRRILPGSKLPQVYKVEPYVYSQFCAGPAAEEFGRGAYHWLTGTAAWMFRAMTDHIFGVKPGYDGLRIRPAVDPKWKQFSMVRQFRGAIYMIEFLNPDGVETGVRELRLDGKPIPGDLLPLPTKKMHRVTVIMGA